MLFKKLVGIAACDPQGTLSKDNKLPWQCQEDLEYFRTTTREAPVIVGHRTFLSMPASYFKKRTSIVFSSRKHQSNPPNQIFVSSLAEFFALDLAFQTIYVIGGSQIYHIFLEANLIQEFLLTKLKTSYEGDTFFSLALLKTWHKTLLRQTPQFTLEHYANKNL